jgi:hypothetical protein
MLFIAGIMALELYVLDEGMPLYKRGFAWTKLIRVWEAMRGDDIQGLLPASMTMRDRGFEAVLDRTKATGPGRKIRWVNVFVSTRAYLINR